MFCGGVGVGGWVGGGGVQTGLQCTLDTPVVALCGTIVHLCSSDGTRMRSYNTAHVCARTRPHTYALAQHGTRVRLYHLVHLYACSCTAVLPIHAHNSDSSTLARSHNTRATVTLYCTLKPTRVLSRSAVSYADSTLVECCLVLSRTLTAPS
jgi:hypothetical protein